jgi:hypothetical protein
MGQGEIYRALTFLPLDTYISTIFIDFSIRLTLLSLQAAGAYGRVKLRNYPLGEILEALIS